MTDEELVDKYAEEYAIGLTYPRFQDIQIANCVLRDVKGAFQKGAEFGYNKAKEDADKMKSRFLELCNLKDMRIAELEKANEWHYVKDGDLPKENQLVLFYRENPLGSNIALSYWYDSYKKDKDLIAWKEIVLPKEIE